MPMPEPAFPMEAEAAAKDLALFPESTGGPDGQKISPRVPREVPFLECQLPSSGHCFGKISESWAVLQSNH